MNLVVQLGFECFMNWFCSWSHLGISDLMFRWFEVAVDLFVFRGLKWGFWRQLDCLCFWSDVRM